MSFSPDFSLLAKLAGKIVIVTGGANGIGLEVIRKCHAKGANVVIADLPSAKHAADKVIIELGSESAIFVPVNVAVWNEIQALYASVIHKFGRVDIVVANAGIMESRPFFDFDIDSNGKLKNGGWNQVIDVNLRGTMNTLRHAVFSMKDNTPDQAGWRGSIVLVSSTSGYTGGTEVVSYISSKHGVIGLLRSSHEPLNRLGIRVNGVAPFITPTFITEGYSTAWKVEGLPTNTPKEVATGIMHMSLDDKLQGKCCLIAGGIYRELEGPLSSSSSSWLGDEMSDIFVKAGVFFHKLGGYPLPGQRSL